jgi:thiosulfate dehydrogenase
MPWTGVHARYPQYRSRSASVQSIEDRINDCFERSLGGKALPDGDERLRAMSAYFALISAGTPVGSRTEGQGLDSVTATVPDSIAGEAGYAARCARCHAMDGAGAGDVPPVWGEMSYSVGAGMGRILTAAAFIQRNMPFDSAGVLSDQQALDIAAYINTRVRRDMPGKENDWPKGGAPADVPYRASLTSVRTPRPN